MDGGLDAVTGLTISQRVSLSNLFVRTSDRVVEDNQKWAHYAQELAGPIIGGFLGNLGMAAFDISRGDGDLAMERLTPTVVKNWLQSNRLEAEGLQNRSGELLIDKEEFDEWDKWSKRVGFGSDKVSDAYRVNEVAHTLDKKLELRKSSLKSNWMRAKERGDTKKMKDIEAQVKIFSSKQKVAKDKLFISDLYKSYKSRKTIQRKSQGGVTRRKADRAEKYGYGEI